MTAKKQTETEVKITSIKKKGTYKKVREDIKKRLASRCNPGGCYEDLIEDYMTMWLTKELLSADIRERGVSVEYDNGGGQKGRKKNESIDLMVKVNSQMLKLLADLGLTPSGDTDGDGDDEL